MNNIFLLGFIFFTHPCFADQTLPAYAVTPELRLKVDGDFRKAFQENSDWFRCPKNGPCLNSLAHLSVSMKFPPERGECTGTLIKDNLILTNRHCIATQLRGDLPSNCFGFINAYFAKGPGVQAELASCKSILFISQNEDLDFAIFSLMEPIKYHKPIKYSPRPIFDGMPLTVGNYTSVAYSQQRRTSCIFGANGLSQCEFFEQSKDLGAIVKGRNGELYGFINNQNGKQKFISFSKFLPDEAAQFKNARLSQQAIEAKEKISSVELEEYFKPRKEKFLKAPQVEISCENPQYCLPELVKVNTGLSLCQGILVDTNIIAAPTACFYFSQGRKIGDYLNSVTTVYLPKVGIHQPDMVTVTDIAISESSPGIVYLKVNKEFRARLSQNILIKPASIGERIITHYMSLDLTYYQSLKKCFAAQNSLFAPGSNLEDFPNIGLGNCRIEPGHSGSPIVDENGGLFGIVSSQAHQNSVIATSLFLDANGLFESDMEWENAGRPFRFPGLGSNFFLIPSLIGLSEGVSLPKYPKGLNFTSNEVPLSVKQDLERRFEQWTATTQLEIKWELKTISIKNVPVFEPNPVCIEKSLVTSAQTKALPFQIKVNGWAQKYDLDFRPRPILQERSDDYTLIIDAQNYSQTGQIALTFVPIGIADGHSFLTDLYSPQVRLVPVCTD